MVHHFLNVFMKEHQTKLISYSSISVHLIPTLVNKQFKLGAPTTFLTRSLAHYDYTK